jgi:hypothetical protein
MVIINILIATMDQIQEESEENSNEWIRQVIKALF